MTVQSEKATGIMYSLLIVISVILLGWRFYLTANGAVADDMSVQFWAATYQIIAWLGVICGFYFASLWGGWKSVVGRANLSFSFGLLAQSFGQSVFSYFFYQGQEVPYPSLADLGFFLSIPFYIYGAALLVKFSSPKRSFKNLFPAIALPAIMLALSYWFFLREYELDWTNALKTILDFGYPLGQAIYVSLAVLALLRARNIMGGIMMAPTLLFICALAVQFFSDYTFLYLINQELYVGSGIDTVDLLYLASYMLMAISLIKLGETYYRIKNS
jgi:hypothetical protein